MKREELTHILEEHNKWLNRTGGSRAKLRYADLSFANLGYADLSDADFSRANLGYANLRYADLSDANFSGADLRDANLNDVRLHRVRGNMREVKSIQLECWSVVYTATTLFIGCQSHPIDDWRNFDDEQIADMDSRALVWWTKWKDFIFQAIALSPATPTNYMENNVSK